MSETKHIVKRTRAPRSQAKPPPPGTYVVHMREALGLDDNGKPVVSSKGGATAAFFLTSSPLGSKFTRVVFGAALCHPEDNFVRSTGHNLAVARLNLCADMGVQMYSDIEYPFTQLLVEDSDGSYRIPSSKFLREAIAAECVFVFEMMFQSSMEYFIELAKERRTSLMRAVAEPEAVKSMPDIDSDDVFMNGTLVEEVQEDGLIELELEEADPKYVQEVVKAHDSATLAGRESPIQASENWDLSMNSLLAVQDPEPSERVEDHEKPGQP